MDKGEQMGLFILLMGKGFLDIYLQTKNREKSTMNESHTVQKTNELKKIQLAAYNWLVDISFLPYHPTVNRDTFVEMISHNKFQLLFRIAHKFNLDSKISSVDKPPNILASLKSLITELTDKGIIKKSISAELVFRCDQQSVLKLIVELHKAALNIQSKIPPQEDYSTILSDWLISLGIIPPYGEKWFTDIKLYLVEDPLRNSEVFTKLCSVVRPTVFIGVIPPAEHMHDIIERCQQAITVLAEEGYCDSSDVQYAEDIVRGSKKETQRLLMRIYTEYMRQQEILISQIQKELQ